jgi:imidazolonepropionase-like amidohydrolase
LITGTRITSVVDATKYDQSPARFIDMGDATLIPGLIDAHVHLSIGGPFQVNALADLRAGFTTVADQGALTRRILLLRDSIAALPNLAGPRILGAGIWVGTKGGVCEFTGIGIAGGADAFVQRVRDNISAGANLTKVCLSSWPAAAYAAPDGVEIPADVLRAIVAASHAERRLVTAHAISRGAARAALDAGVDGIVHAAYVDAALATAMRTKGMWMSPTIASLTSGDTSVVGRALVASLEVAHAAGVTIVFGTDGGVLPHGRGVDEMEMLVAVGLSPLEVIQAATISAAKALAIADSVGQIGVGMSADLLAVRGDPMRDIGALRNPALVVARGQVAVQPPQ